ncbi:hypothetical protein EG335_01425 [Pectobacterium versatile]|nr:hypothetical protein EG335_01425 [Pectobacterium versatile]
MPAHRVVRIQERLSAERGYPVNDRQRNPSLFRVGIFNVSSLSAILCEGSKIRVFTVFNIFFS